MRMPWLLAFVAAFSSCWQFDELERRALCRVEAGPCDGMGGGRGGGDGGGGATGGGGGTTGGGGGTTGGGTATSDAFTAGGLEVRAVARGAAPSESASVDAFDTTISWSATRGCDGGVTNPLACGRTYSLTPTGNVRLTNPGRIEEADVPLSSAVGPNVVAFFNVAGGGTTNMQLTIAPQDARSLGGIYGPAPAAPQSGVVAWLGPGRQVIAAFPSFGGNELTIWPYDYDALSGARQQDPVSPVVPFASCDVRVDDAARTLRADGSPTGSVCLAIARPPPCSNPGVVLVQTDGGVASVDPLALPVGRMRLATAPGTLWAGSPLDGGGSELRGFEIGASGVLTAAPRVWQVPAPADWHLADVTADQQGRAYLLGDGTGPMSDGGQEHAVWIFGHDLDGGLRFRLPLPGTSQARAVAAAWSFRGLVVAGDCDAGAADGVCAGAPGAFLTVVRVPE